MAWRPTPELPHHGHSEKTTMLRKLLASSADYRTKLHLLQFEQGRWKAHIMTSEDVDLENGPSAQHAVESCGHTWGQRNTNTMEILPSTPHADASD